MTILLITVAAAYGIFAWNNFPKALSIFPALLPLYLMRTSIGPFPTTLLELLFLALLSVAVLKNKLKIRNLPAGRQGLKLEIPIALFLLAATIGVFVSPDKVSALGILKAYFVEPIIFFLLISQNLNDKKYFCLMLRALLLSALVISLWAILQKFTGWGIPHPWVEERRVTGPYPYPNAVGLFLAPLIIFFLYMKRYMGEAWKKIVILSLPLMFAAIILAKTESGLMAITIVLAALIIRAQKDKTKRIAAVALAFTIAFVLASQPAPLKPITDKLLLKDWSGIVRRVTWNETTKMLKDRPVFGAGLAGYQKTLAPYHTSKIEIFLYPHNIILNFWSELGLLGLLTFVWLIAAFLIKVKKMVKDEQLRPFALASGGAMAVMLIHGLVDVPYFKNDLSMLFWLMLAIPAIAQNIDQEAKK